MSPRDLCSAMRYITIFTFSVLSLVLAYSSTAKTIVLLDQDQQAIPNAVISIPLGAKDQAVMPSDIAIMDQVNKQFFPNVLVIKQGQKVEFPNSDNIRHHVFSFSSPKPFEIKLYKDTQIEPILFDKPGLVVVGCNIHDKMIGYIYIAQNEQTFITDSTGSAIIPDEVSSIQIWHAKLSKQIFKRQLVQLNLAKSENEIVNLPLIIPSLITPTKSDKKTFSSKKKFGSK
jgi:plastocyanin